MKAPSEERSRRDRWYGRSRPHGIPLLSLVAEADRDAEHVAQLPAAAPVLGELLEVDCAAVVRVHVLHGQVELARIPGNPGYPGEI